MSIAIKEHLKEIDLIIPENLLNCCFIITKSKVDAIQITLDRVQWGQRP